MKANCNLPSLSSILITSESDHINGKYTPLRMEHYRQDPHSYTTIETPDFYSSDRLSDRVEAARCLEDKDPIKAKRKRATPFQLHVLSTVFVHTHFPSTELRAKLGKQLGMSPRTVQIWFQNKRQSRRTKEKSLNNPPQHPYSHSASDPRCLPTSPSLRVTFRKAKENKLHTIRKHHNASYNLKNPSYISLPPLRLLQSPLSPLPPTTPTKTSPIPTNSTILPRN